MLACRLGFAWGAMKDRAGSNDGINMASPHDSTAYQRASAAPHGVVLTLEEVQCGTTVQQIGHSNVPRFHAGTVHRGAHLAVTIAALLPNDRHPYLRSEQVLLGYGMQHISPKGDLIWNLVRSAGTEHSGGCPPYLLVTASQAGSGLA